MPIPQETESRTTRQSKIDGILAELLEGVKGGVLLSVILAGAKKLGITQGTLMRAKKSLKCSSVKTGKDWCWLLGGGVRQNAFDEIKGSE